MKKLQEWLRLYSSLAVFLFFSLSLTLPTGYSYGASLLLLGGLATIISLNYSTFKPKDWLLLAAMLSYTTIHLLGILIHNLSIREFDKPLRIALGGIAQFPLVQFLMVCQIRVCLDCVWECPADVLLYSSALLQARANLLAWRCCNSVILLLLGHQAAGVMHRKNSLLAMSVIKRKKEILLMSCIVLATLVAFSCFMPFG